MVATVSGRERIWAVLIVLAVLVLLPVGRSSELPLLIGALGAVVIRLRGGLDWQGQGARLVLLLFGCYWLPALASGFAAVAPTKTWDTIATTLRFAPYALFVVWALRDARQWRGLTLAVGAVVMLWMIDAWVQILTGYSLGGGMERERLSGIFGADNVKLGPVLATLSPFLLLAARERFGRRGLAIAFALSILPILLAGSRAAWLSFALVCIVLAWRETRRPARFLAVIAVAGAAIIAVAALAWQDSARFDARMVRTLRALEGTPTAIDEASAGRLSIWHAAVAMNAAHPLTGVGVRGFRYAYPHYARDGDPFVDASNGTGASHAHQIVLEVLSETGLIGLLLWLVGAAIAVRAWWRADADARNRALAPALSLVAMCFPLNTHLAFYSAWWGLLFWWLLALYCAALAARSLPETAIPAANP